MSGKPGLRHLNNARNAKDTDKMIKKKKDNNFCNKHEQLMLQICELQEIKAELEFDLENVDERLNSLRKRYAYLTKPKND
jgi:hypothetical protein